MKLEQASKVFVDVDQRYTFFQEASAGRAKMENRMSKIDPLDPRFVSEVGHQFVSNIADQPPPIPNANCSIWGLVIEDMKERDRVGRERYGVPLQAHNGRDALIDAYQEALDLAVYLRQAIEECRLKLEGNMKIKPKVVCLCGSTRFVEAFHQAMRELTLAGKIVLTVGLFGHQECLDMGGPVKAMLDELHLAKIDLADEVHVLNVGGYIGESTRREIDYATQTGKIITYREPDVGGN